MVSILGQAVAIRVLTSDSERARGRNPAEAAASEGALRDLYERNLVQDYRARIIWATS